MTNIVLVHTDDTGRYVGPYGHDIDTPWLSTLAEEGVLFRRAYTAGPTCSPSRAALFSGQSPHEAGMVGLAHRGFTFGDYDQHLAGYLSDHGIESVLAGQQHEVALQRGDYPHDRNLSHLDSDTDAAVLGYDRELDGDEDAVRDLPVDSDLTRRDLANAAAAAEYVRSEPADEFFLSLGLYNTHKPFPLEQDLVDPDTVQIPAPLPDVPEIRAEIAAYQAVARYVDECFGRVYDALDDTGELDETLLVFTTDHGIPLPRMKCELRESGLGISLIARFPEGSDVPRGGAEDALVSNVDHFPTYCDLLDIETPDWTTGESLLPLVRNQVDSVHDAIFGEVTYHAAYEPKRCITTDRYRYVRRFDDAYTTRVSPNTDAGPAKTFFQKRGFYDRDLPRAELYDLHLDPGEGENLIDDPAYEDVREDLAERLDDWMERTDDPLLDGPVSKPEGAVADPQHGIDPDEGEYEPSNVR